MYFEATLFQWDEGLKRLRTVEPQARPLLERTTAVVVEELRRRLGGTFTTHELIELYMRGTDWCLDLAIATAPDSPAAWDSQIIADAAFAIYLREASDFAGGQVAHSKDKASKEKSHVR